LHNKEKDGIDKLCKYQKLQAIWSLSAWKKRAKYHDHSQGKLETILVIPREITNGRITATHREN
jgi:hypothetical protein